MQPYSPIAAYGPAPVTPQPRSQLPLVLGILGGAFVLLAAAGGVIAYVLRQQGIKRDANAWTFEIEGDSSDDAVTVDVSGTPIGAKVTIADRSFDCDAVCRTKLTRKDLAGAKPSASKDIHVVLEWKGLRVEKSHPRKLFEPQVTLGGSSLEPGQRYCDLVANDSSKSGESKTINVLYAATSGMRIDAKGAPGDTVTINGKSFEPGEAHEETISNEALRGLLGMGAAVAGQRNAKYVLIRLPVSVKSSDGAGYEGQLTCNGDMLAPYLAAQQRSGALVAKMSPVAKSGALFIGDSDLRYIGEATNALDARLVVMVSRSEMMTRECTYGSFTSKYLTHRFHAHDLTALDARTGAVRGKKRFLPKTAGWSCPDRAEFSSGQTSRDEIVSPPFDDETTWATTLL